MCIRDRSRRAFRPERQADSLKQAKQVELALRLQVGQNLLGRKILHADDEPIAKRPEFVRETMKCRLGQHLECLEGWRLGRVPRERIGRCGFGHAPVFKRERAMGQGADVDGRAAIGERRTGFNGLNTR